jgi:hypothetical protein
VARPIQLGGLYWAGFLCLLLGILKLTVEKHWTWWRVLLPIWAVLGHNLLYIGVGFVWLTIADDGITEEEVLIRELDHTHTFQLTALLCFAVFADNVLRRIEGAHRTGGFWLSSGRWELIVVFGILSVALNLLFWSEVMPSPKRGPRSH